LRRVRYDKESGLTAFFISKRDLVAAKLAAGRMRDLADVEEIRESESSTDEPAGRPDMEDGDE
jgi:hypothetical protein